MHARLPVSEVPVAVPGYSAGCCCAGSLGTQRLEEGELQSALRRLVLAPLG